MAQGSMKLTRDQLAAFLKDHQSIKQFEKLFTTVDAIAPDFVNEVSIAAGDAQAAANEALAQLTRIANALEMLATAPVIQNNNSVVTDYIDLPENGPHVTQTRRVQWNSDDGTMDVGLYGGSVLQVGQETHYYSKNTSGALIANGTPVMFTGTVGASGKLTFGLAVANGSVPSEYMMGVATQDIADNAFGYITSFGLVRGFNTTGSPYGEVWTDGDLLYFDPATSGTWTNVQPAAPNISVPVAVVINSSAGAGSIFVRMELSESLNKLQDVTVTTPANRDLLQYDGTAWRNVTDLELAGYLTLPKTSGYGIKVDETAPTFGWRDLTAPVDVRGVGGNDPAFAVYTGTTLRAFQFSATVMNEVFFVYHVPHDYVPGTNIYFHAHWSNAAAVPNTGNVVWSFDYSFSKGFSQAAFPAVSTATVIAASPATRYTHNVSETAAVTIASMEIDGLILVRAYRDAANASDTCTDDVFLHTCGIHYQSSNMATKNKAPNFYA